MSFQANPTSMTPSSRWPMKTVAPGLMPSLSRNAFGMTTWPLGPTLPLTDVPNGESIPSTSRITVIIEYNQGARW